MPQSKTCHFASFHDCASQQLRKWNVAQLGRLRLIGQRTTIIMGTISELLTTSHQCYAPFQDFSRSRYPEACRGSCGTDRLENDFKEGVSIPSTTRFFTRAAPT